MIKIFFKINYEMEIKFIKLYYYFYVILISSFLSSQNARQNKLDQEHWIKHFTFIGPFSDESSANNILTDVLENES